MPAFDATPEVILINSDEQPVAVVQGQIIDNNQPFFLLAGLKDDNSVSIVRIDTLGKIKISFD